MRSARLWKRLLGVEHTVVEQVLYDQDASAVVACVRPSRSRRWRCPRCARRCPGYDQGEGRRRWRYGRQDDLSLRPGNYALGVAVGMADLLTPLAMVGWPGGALPVRVAAEPDVTHNLAHEAGQLVRIAAVFDDMPLPLDR